MLYLVFWDYLFCNLVHSDCFFNLQSAMIAVAIQSTYGFCNLMMWIFFPFFGFILLHLCRPRMELCYLTKLPYTWQQSRMQSIKMTRLSVRLLPVCMYKAQKYYFRVHFHVWIVQEPVSSQLLLVEICKCKVLFTTITWWCDTISLFLLLPHANLIFSSLEQCIWLRHELHQEASIEWASCWHSWPESNCY